MVPYTSPPKRAPATTPNRKQWEVHYRGGSAPQNTCGYHFVEGFSESKGSCSSSLAPDIAKGTTVLVVNPDTGEYSPFAVVQTYRLVSVPRKKTRGAKESKGIIVVNMMDTPPKDKTLVMLLLCDILSSRNGDPRAEVVANSVDVASVRAFVQTSPRFPAKPHLRMQQAFEDQHRLTSAGATAPSGLQEQATSQPPCAATAWIPAHNLTTAGQATLQSPAAPTADVPVRNICEPAVFQQLLAALSAHTAAAANSSAAGEATRQSPAATAQAMDVLETKLTVAAASLTRAVSASAAVAMPTNIPLVDPMTESLLKMVQAIPTAAKDEAAAGRKFQLDSLKLLLDSQAKPSPPPHHHPQSYPFAPHGPQFAPPGLPYHGAWGGQGRHTGMPPTTQQWPISPKNPIKDGSDGGVVAVQQLPTPEAGSEGGVLAVQPLPTPTAAENVGWTNDGGKGGQGPWKGGHYEKGGKGKGDSQPWVGGGSVSHYGQYPQYGLHPGWQAQPSPQWCGGNYGPDPRQYYAQY
jgi:hypothetical protein